MVKQSEAIQGTEKEFLNEFHKLCYSRSSWQVWADLMTAIACSISNVADRSPEHYESREKEYAQCIERLGSVEIPAKMLAIIVEALERNPEQDFLGEMYMQLNLGNHWKGQFFTPYCVCKMMSEITCEDVDSHIEKQGYLSICDPACGAGATLIAAANTMKKCKHNFQNHVVFVAQDIDRITGTMCYIQLSLLGCAGYVCIADTITNPLTGHVLFPNEKEGQELWYMPMFQNQIWTWRRLFQSMGGLGGTAEEYKALQDKKAAAEKKRREKLAAKKMAETKKAMEEIFSRNDGVDAFQIKGKGLILVVPQSGDEIRKEGEALHHCVGGYVDRVARGETNIFFIRKADHPEKSYFTMEWRDNKIIQCRGFKNCGMPADVQAFVKVFEKKMNEAIQGDNKKNAERKAG